MTGEDNLSSSSQLSIFVRHHACGARKVLPKQSVELVLQWRKQARTGQQMHTVRNTFSATKEWESGGCLWIRRSWVGRHKPVGEGLSEVVSLVLRLDE